jgi:hypothetical protein
MTDIKRGDRCIDKWGNLGTVTDRYEGGTNDIPCVAVHWDRVTPLAMATVLITEVNYVEQCPECDFGHVVSDGPMESDTGHRPFRCSHRCGWTS